MQDRCSQSRIYKAYAAARQFHLPVGKRVILKVVAECSGFFVLKQIKRGTRYEQYYDIHHMQYVQS